MTIREAYNIWARSDDAPGLRTHDEWAAALGVKDFDAIRRSCEVTEQAVAARLEEHLADMVVLVADTLWVEQLEREEADLAKAGAA